MHKLYTNVNIIAPCGIKKDACLLTNDGKIAYIGDHPGDTISETVDLGGNFLAPGFIDTHVHGGGGADAMDATDEAFDAICAHHFAHGVTSLLFATLAAPRSAIDQTLAAFEQYSPKPHAATPLGVHLEGPYFAKSQRGAQDPRYIRDPNPVEYIEQLLHKCVKRVSVAPELSGAYEFGDYAAARGVIVSAAHTDATFEQAETALAHGFSLMTHLYSGMSGVHRINAFRVGGCIEAGLFFDGYAAEIIADGCHLPASLLRFIYKCKGADGIILTSDASRGAGLPDGATIKLGSKSDGLTAIIEDGVAKTPDRLAFAGSIASGDRLVRTMVNLAGVPLHEAVNMVSLNPAKMLKISDKKGALAVGFDAEMVVLSKDLRAVETIIVQ